MVDTAAENVARRFIAARKPIMVQIVDYLKASGGRAEKYDVFGIGGRNTGKVVMKMVRDGYLGIERIEDDDGDETEWLILKSEPESVASGGKITKARLEAWAKKKGWPEPSYEAYGRKVHAYFWKNPPGMSRQEMEAELESVGAKVERRWNKGQPGTSVTNISYFKARGWDE
jgi:hypothetical protein